MLVELAIGDAYGAQFEGSRGKDIHKSQNQLGYMKGLPTVIKVGHYTDDTQMTLAIAEALLEDDEWTKESLADRFVKVFHRDERRGYTSGFYNILSEAQNGKELLGMVDGQSKKGGAAMRAAPLGLIPDCYKLLDYGAAQAQVTHFSRIGVGSANIAALMVHYFAYELGKKAELVEWLRSWLPADERESMICGTEPFEADGEMVTCWAPNQDRYVRSHGWDVVHAAIYAILEHNSLSAILQQCVTYGGDTDTVATIAMAAASWSTETKQDLPQRLYDQLENGTYGRDYLKKLDADLRQKFGITR